MYLRLKAKRTLYCSIFACRTDTQTSGLAGIAYWINEHFGLEGDKCIDKRDPLVLSIKSRVDVEYDNGRQNSITDGELIEWIEEFRAAN